jgi:hypothetical protein
MIELRFGGTSCAVRAQGDGGLYNVFADGELSVRRFGAAETVHQLASGLADTIHTLRITKRFESQNGRVASISGFFIDGGKSLHPLDPAPRYRIEFIGGSNLIGLGVEAGTIYCDTPSVYSNSYLAFGSVAARELDAESHIIAISGKGVTRNWNAPYIASPRPFSAFYNRTLRGKPSPEWDFKSWSPHVAVAYLGINDFSTRPHPTKELFIAQYRGFIDGIFGRYPDVQIVCAISSREPVKTYVRELVDSMRKEGNGRIHFYSFAQVPRELCGCDWHPGAAAHEKIGRELADVIRPLLGRTPSRY